MAACSRSSQNCYSPCISTTICRRQLLLQLHHRTQKTEQQESDNIWVKIVAEACLSSAEEPGLSNYYQALILNHKSLDSALAYHLAVKLSVAEILPVEILYPVFMEAFKDDDREMSDAVRADLRAARERDPACETYLECFLNYKGFLALQSHKAAHWCWKQTRPSLALTIQGRASAAFGVDIHPGARIGKGVLIDHGTGVVIGETAVVGDGVTMLHGVTLGGRGESEAGEDRHPKVGDGVFIGAGASVLGNVTVGRAAKIGAAAVLLKDVPAEATAVGNPARLIA